MLKRWREYYARKIEEGRQTNEFIEIHDRMQGFGTTRLNFDGPICQEISWWTIKALRKEGYKVAVLRKPTTYTGIGPLMVVEKRREK